MLGKINKRNVDALKPSRRDAYLWDNELRGFGCKVTPSGKKIYLVQYRPRSQAEKRSTAPRRLTLGRHGTLTPEKARDLAAKALLEVRAGGDPAKRLQPGESPTVAKLMEQFLTKYLPTKKRPPRERTVVGYESLNRCHVLPAIGGKRVSELTTADIERLHSSMRRKPYEANRVLSMLQQAFDQAERWGWRLQATNPAKHIDRYAEERRGERREVMLDAKQMARLLDAIDKEEAEGSSSVACAAIRVAFWTGWRISEVLGLEWRNVDLDTRRVKLLKTKTAAEEYRQLPEEALAIISRVESVAGCPYVFPGRDLKSSLTHVRKPWTEIRRRAGLADLEELGAFRLHDLRHNVVSWDVSRGVALEIAGRNVGHRSRRSTEVYAHFAPDGLKRAADERASAMRAALEAARESIASEELSTMTDSATRSTSTSAVSISTLPPPTR